MKRIYTLLLAGTVAGSLMQGCRNQTDYSDDYIHSGRYSAQGVYYDEDYCARQWDRKLEEDYFYHFRDRYWGEPKGPAGCGDDYDRVAHRR